MKKLNRTYIMGIVFIILALWVLFQTTQIPEKLVSNEPGPKLFPYISAIGMIVMAVLSALHWAACATSDLPRASTSRFRRV